MLSALAWLLAAPAIALLGWFTLEILLGLRPLPAPFITARRTPRTAVLIPAHNEALGIGETLRHLHATDPAITILVVADNCTDDTADAARAAGAEVIERHDPVRRGKGFALAFGRDYLAQLPHAKQPEVVVVLDADCRTDEASVALLAKESLRLSGPVQARNLLVAPPTRPSALTGAKGTETPVNHPSPLTQLSNFAMLVKNLVRARGLQRVGGGIPLFGTGMAFPWPLFATAQLATDHLVEDIQLALALARKGVAVTLVEDARVESAPAPDNAVAAQRGRWERGFLGTALSQGLPMLAGGIASGSRHRAALGMHLLVPPLALLLMLSAILLLGAAALGLAGASRLPAASLFVALLAALVSVTLAWAREGRSTLSRHAALEAPLYLLWKIPLYLGFLRKDSRGWTRTRRAGEGD